MEYFEEAKIISKDLNDFLTDLYKQDELLSDIIKVYTDKEIHLNGVQFVGGFLVGGGNKEQAKDYYLFSIITELVMIWAYRTNQILDEKKNIWSEKEKIKECVLEHDKILSLIFDLLKKAKDILNLDIDYVYFDFLIKQFMSNLAKGFYFERKELNINFSKINSILENWEVKYRNRNINFDSLYDYSPLIGFWLSSKDKSIFYKYEKYFSDRDTFASFGQIINDIGDWSISQDIKVKAYQDKFADIRNGIITFPIYNFIDNDDIKSALKNSKITFDENWQKRVSLLAVELLPELKKKADLLYKDLEIFWKENTKNVENSNIELLMNSYLIIKLSKYLNKKNYE